MHGNHSHSRDRSCCHTRGPVRRAGVLLTVLSLGVLTSCAGDPGPMGSDDPDDQPASAPAATHPEADTDPDDGLDDDPDDDSSNAGGPSRDDGLHDDGDIPEMIPAPVQETQTLVSEHISSWQEYSTSSETELQVAFYSGNPACYGVRSVMEEDDTEVRVATISGTLPDAVGSACTQEARYVSLVIELDEPLGEREVLPLTEVELAP